MHSTCICGPNQYWYYIQCLIRGFLAHIKTSRSRLPPQPLQRPTPRRKPRYSYALTLLGHT